MLVVASFVAGTVTIVAIGDSWPLLAWGGYTVVGALLLSLRARSWIGAMMLAVGLYWAMSGLLYIPWFLNATSVWLEMIVLALSPVIWTLVPLLVTIFPDDRITSRFGAVNATLVIGLAGTMLVAGLINPAPLELSGRTSPLAVAAAAPVTTVVFDAGAFLVLLALIAAALVDLVLRWRRSQGVRRLQFRWIFYGGTITLGILLLAQLFPVLPDPAVIVIVLGFNAIPVAIFISLSRHGLYEVDRVISRTVSYVLVTGIAVGVYAVVVTSVTWLLPEAPSIGVAAATLAAAALFLPVLRWVQRVVDRRFDRERYDAQRIVDAFGERLRTQVDSATTTSDLVTVVDDALQPTAVGVWAKEAGR